MNPFSRFFRWFSTPQSSSNIKKKNFVNVQIDAIGVGLASSASPFLSVFLARLGASNLQVSLLTSMPAITGFLMAIPAGNLLQRQKNIVPWFSASRLLVLSGYALTGLVTFFVPKPYLPIAILAIWALATLPQTTLSITFSVVMNAVAGPAGRYELMTRRWSLLGLTQSVTVLIIGAVLDHLGFPFNYQMVFIGLSVGGLISYYFSSQIDLPDVEPPPVAHGGSIQKRVREYLGLIRGEKPFVSFLVKRFVFLTGTTLATPIFPLYFVRELNASDSWIAAINTAQLVVLIVGYYFWSQQSRKKGSRMVLLWATAGLSLYPLLTALTHDVLIIVIYSGIAGIFQAGVDLVFFDELMKTVPPEYSATFVSFAQSIQYVSTIAAPLLGSWLANYIGLGGALMVSAGFRFLGFILFFFSRPPVKNL